VGTAADALSSQSFAEEAAKPEVKGDAAIDVAVEEAPEAARGGKAEDHC